MRRKVYRCSRCGHRVKGRLGKWYHTHVETEVETCRAVTEARLDPPEFVWDDEAAWGEHPF